VIGDVIKSGHLPDQYGWLTAICSILSAV